MKSEDKSMKKIVICLSLLIFSQVTTQAHPYYYNDYCRNHGSCTSNYYLTHKDFSEEKHKFTNCNKHEIITKTTNYFYSNGTRHSYSVSSVINSDGTLILEDCHDVKHFIYNKNHYFIFYKNKKYQIADDKGNFLTVKNYKSMKELSPGKFLVSLDKKYGVIDINEQILIPIKYKKFEEISKNLYLTQLNSYFGLINSDNKIILKNEYDKISPICEVLLLKKFDKYGLADLNGNILLNPEYKSIKSSDEFIIVQNNKKYAVFDKSGKQLTDFIYKKIKLERNILKGKVENNSWNNIFSDM